jgi:hypothetical protein
METQINSFRFTKPNPSSVTIFGYSSKSFPGLEIHGLGRYGKSLKEKIIYITRSRHLTVPVKRYVIVCELEHEATHEDIWFDFPILLIYWHLAHILPIERLENCLAVGQLHPSGIITEKWDAMALNEVRKKEWFLISGEKKLTQMLPSFSARELLSHIPELKWREFPPVLPKLHGVDHSFSGSL